MWSLKSFVALVAACLVFAHAPQVAAQKLNGLASLNLAVEKFDESARPCGVTQEGIEAAVRIALANSGPKIVDVFGGPFYYVQVSILQVGQEQCVGEVLTAVHRSVWLTPDGPKVSAAVWYEGKMLSFHRNDFGRRVNNAVEDLTKLMLGVWLKDNQR